MYDSFYQLKRCNQSKRGITLVKKQDKVIEFRVHLNKDGSGNWHITSILGRTNEKFGVNNQINRSGDILSITDMLEANLLSKKMITNMKECALLLSKEREVLNDENYSIST